MNQAETHIIDFSQFTAAAAAQPVRRFLFLQGPHGAFFATLAGAVKSEGHAVHRIHFNGGDKGDWMKGQGISFTGPLSEWKEYLTDYIFRHNITDIVFYGYWRPHHRSAAILAEKLDLRIHGFEEGLLRPHWITLDPRLPCTQAADLRTAVAGGPVIAPYAAVPDLTGKRPDSPTSGMIFSCIRHYLNYFRHRKLFCNYRTHRMIMAGVESRAFIKQFFTYPQRKAVSMMRLGKALRDPAPFFIFCLQLDGDSQIQKYSAFTGMEEVLEQVLDSFARHAPAGTKLVVKNHPLDNGIRKLEQKCRRIARAKGIAHRVTFLNFGKLAGLLKKTRGMIAVNSSAGLQALFHHCPVKALGLSIYNIEGLADQQPLDHFWQAPQAPDAEIYKKLHDILAQTSQHPGSFYDKGCHGGMIRSCLKMLLPAEKAAGADQQHEAVERLVAIA